MIVAVKRKGFYSKKSMIFTLIALIAMFGAYYYHMSGKIKDFEGNPNSELAVKGNVDKNEIRARKIERIIFKEAETIVDMIGQKYIRQVEIVKNRLLLVLDANTNIEPILVRYGVLALVKNTKEDIKIAIELDKIVESKYEQD